MAKPKVPEPDLRVCEKCLKKSPAGETKCSFCGGERFAPEWIRDLRRVNRVVSVQLSRPQERDGEQPPDRITLYKWWPGGRQTYNIPNEAQWRAIRTIIDEELGPILGWKTVESVADAVDGLAQGDKAAEKKVKAAASLDPSILAKLVKGIDLSKVDPADYSRLGDALGEMASVYVNADDGLRRSIQKIVKSLPKQGEEAIRKLAELMETLTIAQIAAVTTEVQRRMSLLNSFKDRITDERTYEIRGAGSIHRLLESAMWIIDERYWLMFSNATLRTVVGDDIVKRHKLAKDKRPDFVCGMIDGKLVIIEIKRPAHKLTVADLNQLEEYIVLVEQYQKYNGFEATLVGKSISDELLKVLKVRRTNFRAITYTQLLGEAERRYSEYITALGAP